MSLEAENVTFSYGNIPVLKDFSLSLKKDDFVMLLGSNGSGKSTAVKLLGGFLVPTSGKISCDGNALNTLRSFERAKKIAVVSQIPPPILDFTVDEMVMMGRIGHTPRLAPPSSDDWAKVHEVMEHLEILHLKKRLMHDLSGGERQRVWLAQALSREPEYLLLDEPTSALDPEHALGLMRFLQTLKGRVGILMICHDLNLAWNFARRVLILKNGKTAASGSRDKVLTADNIAENFNCRAVIYPDEGIILH